MEGCLTKCKLLARLSTCTAVDGRHKKLGLYSGGGKAIKLTSTVLFLYHNKN